MSHQYPGPQQPYQQPYQGPTPYQPPPSPKKGMSAWAIVGITLGGIFAFVLVLGVIGAIAGDGAGSASDTAVAVTDSPTLSPTVSPAIEAPAPSKAAVKPAPKPKPAAPKPPEYSDGDYVIGEDMPPGTYTSEGAQKGLFEFCSVTTKPADDSTWPQIKSANADERIIITLKKSDGVVTISGCEPLTRR